MLTNKFRRNKVINVLLEIFSMGKYNNFDEVIMEATVQSKWNPHPPTPKHKLVTVLH